MSVKQSYTKVVVMANSGEEEADCMLHKEIRSLLLQWSRLKYVYLIIIKK
ncbi:hypothetical protein [Saccharicrinis fermentans]|nr:hypothetical protein [Saccharicrinis fermentans]